MRRKSGDPYRERGLRSSKEDLRRTSLSDALTLTAAQQRRFALAAETWAG